MLRSGGLGPRAGTRYWPYEAWPVVLLGAPDGPVDVPRPWAHAAGDAGLSEVHTESAAAERTLHLRRPHSVALHRQVSTTLVAAPVISSVDRFPQRAIFR